MERRFEKIAVKAAVTLLCAPRKAERISDAFVDIHRKRWQDRSVPHLPFYQIKIIRTDLLKPIGSDFFSRKNKTKNRAVFFTAVGAAAIAKVPFGVLTF